MTVQHVEPTYVTRGGDPESAVVVLLHGRGSNERDIIALADHLPAGPEYVALRGPIPEGGGYAWFHNRGIGRPQPDSLRETMEWFRGWLDAFGGGGGRPVLLVGFSGGAAFAGGLVLSNPARYAGTAILCGTLPFDAGIPTEPGRLSDVPVFVAHGEHDTVIPRELLDRTWDYLTGDSGALTVAHRDASGHEISAGQLQALHAWLADRLQTD